MASALRRFLCSCVVVICFLSVIVTQSMWHTSQTALNQLYRMQTDQHFAVVRDYLRAESERLDELQNILATANEWHNQHKFDKTTYLQNHINAVQYIKRICRQLRKVKEKTDKKQSLKALSKITNLNSNDVLYSCRGLRRLQKFFEISAMDMAQGRYKDRIIGDQLNACECYAMVKYCYKERDIFGIADWAVQTYTKWKDGDKPQCVDVEKLIFILLETSIITGYDFKTILKWPSSDFSRSTDKLEQYLTLMSNEISPPNERRTFDVFDTYDNLDEVDIGIQHKRLCRLHGKSKRVLTKECVCRYQTKNSPYRILMPFKEEDVHWDPPIKIYYDVIYDGEIESVKTMCSEIWFDSAILTENGKNILDENTRSGQVCFINDSMKMGVLDSLNDRIECFTGRSTKNAESYQVVNYGLGGHYKQHYDAFNIQNMNKKFGNRILTVLFYLSDVQDDGCTTFPMLDIVCPARKGTALVWYNLHSDNGYLHRNSLHGACPILKGNKWIMTRWLYEEGQSLPYDWRNKLSESVETDKP